MSPAWPIEESEELVDTLWAHIAVQEPVASWHHTWRVGDLLIWDNRRVMHRRNAFPPELHRVMHAPRSRVRSRYSTHLHDFAYHTIAFPVSSAGGDAPAMRAHRQAFPTPRGSGKRDPKGGLARPPGATGGCPPGYGMRGTPPRPPASSRAACDASSITERRAPSRKPRKTVV